MFTFPNVHNKEKHVWEQELQIDDILLSKKRTTSKNLQQSAALCKICEKTLPAKGGNNKRVTD